MSFFMWQWRYYIAPAPIVERVLGTEEKIVTHWGSYISKEIFSGFKHPVAGDVVNIPNYGPCKVERMLYWVNRPSRRFTLGVVISPKSLGDAKWWQENKNNPVARYSDNWSFDMELNKRNFTDLEIPLF